jgi:hypothetical protein
LISFSFFSVVHYDERAATEGCAVDLITRDATMANRIAFWATVKDPNGLLSDNSCLTDTMCQIENPEVVSNNFLYFSSVEPNFSALSDNV